MAFRQVQTRRRSKPRALPNLPTYYYHTNFCDMLSFVQSRYQHVFEEKHEQFLTNFADLPYPAQCLYVRIASRKGEVFDSTKLSYSEIENLEQQFGRLQASGFTTGVTKERYTEFLKTLTKPDLVTLMAEHLCPSSFKRSWKKDRLIETALETLPFEDASLPDHFLVQGHTETLRYLTFLYFGKIQDNLQNFTLRDLGLLATPDFKADYTARFDSLPEARTAYFYLSALHQFKTDDDSAITHLMDSYDDWPEPECDTSVTARDKLLQKLGGLSERCGDIETALSLYGQSQAPLCNERRIRLRWNRNAEDDRDWVKVKLEELIENPGNDDEHNFAQDFYARKLKKKRTSLVTDILRNGEVLEIDEMFRHKPEMAAKRYYEAQGYKVHLTENAIWRMLFGLLFWNQLYGQDAKLHNAFERMPVSLKSGRFYAEYDTIIEDILSKLTDTGAVHVTLLKTVSRHHGTPNGLFRWSGRTLDKLKALIEAADSESLTQILRLISKDYRGMKDGYPDLMLIRDSRVSFKEVKSEGDVIRRNQLTRIKQLRAAGFDTEITCINWRVNPNQIYVVVDVETTGGRPGPHRVTEIGAVKVQNGKIIDEFQTLINPRRSIPPFITRLTGITPDMVKNAPSFRDIADDFMAFMGDAIFVAHNVNFDYGFISFEFKSLDYPFRHPKLCTCASMRKHYPGHSSYSLKNLCGEFGIDLTSHHRALCDAKAAAELLFLVNDKRALQ